MKPALFFVALALLGPVESRPQAPLDLSGTWQEDHVLSRQLTESRGHRWTVAGAGGGERTAADDARLLRTELRITQTPSQLVFDVHTGSDVRRTTFKVDETDSVNTSTASITTRSRSSWQAGWPDRTRFQVYVRHKQ